MIQHERSEQDLRDRLALLGGTSSDDDLDDILGRTARTRQRPAWTFPGRWLPMLSQSYPQPHAAQLPWFRVWVLAVLVLLAIALAVGAAIMVGSRSSPGPNLANAAALPPTACPAGTTLHSGDIATIAGGGTGGPASDGSAAVARTLSAPGAIAVDAAGSVYFTDDASAIIWRVGSDGILKAVTGPAADTGFITPSGMAFDDHGNLFVADFQASRIWRVDPTGAISVLGGTGVSGSSGNEGPATAADLNVFLVAVGPDRSVYFDDANMYRTIDPKGIIHAFAGTGATGFSGDDGRAIDATMNTAIAAVGADAAGMVYVGDSWNHRIRRIDPNGIITTFVGNGTQGELGDSGSAVDAEMSQALAITTDPDGDVYFTDNDSASVRMIDTSGVITTVAGSGTAGSAGDCGPATSARLSPTALAFHDGALFIADTGNDRIRMVMP